MRIWNWFRRERPPSQPAIHVILYSRTGCHLCDEAHDLLAEHHLTDGFTLETIDIDSDPVLAKTYGKRIPVVIVNGKERFHGRVNAALLARTLAREVS